MSVLARDVWTSRAEAHRTQVEAWTTPHLERRSRGHKHPVEDFLFDYYAFRPAELRRWHPGFGVTLGDAPEYDGLKGYQVVDGAASVTDTYLCAQPPLVRQIETLLRATADRPAAYGCFGLHEWAMVYRLSQEQVRHAAWPLRLGSAGTDAVVESHTVACSHFDAFRFFTPPARPLNILQPGRDDRPVFEQPGCLHANMDLYKHAARLAPLVGSDLVVAGFALAKDIREFDMRASPYDLSALGLEPVRIETAAGKAQYVAAQREFAERAAPLRAALLARITALGSQATRC